MPHGYTMSTDEGGFAQLNPLYMKYTPGPSGHFAGQQGYGYRSIEEFVAAGGWGLTPVYSAFSIQVELLCVLVTSQDISSLRRSQDKCWNGPCVAAAEEVNSGAATAADISARGVLATIDTTARVTAMLEAGRVSLDNGGVGARVDKNPG